MRLYPAVGLMCIIWVFSSPISAQDLTGEDKYTYLKQLDHFLSIPNNGLYNGESDVFTASNVINKTRILFLEDELERKIVNFL